MDIEFAIKEMQNKKMFRRSSWRDKRMFLFISNNYIVKDNLEEEKFFNENVLKELKTRLSNVDDNFCISLGIICVHGDNIITNYSFVGDDIIAQDWEEYIK